MLAGLLQQDNLNFEGVACRKFNALSRGAYGLAPTEELQKVLGAGNLTAIGYRFPFRLVSSQWNKQMEKNRLLERLKVRRPPTEFQDVCLKTFCAVRAMLRLRSYTQAICCVQRFPLWEPAFVPPSQVIFHQCLCFPFLFHTNVMGW